MILVSLKKIFGQIFFDSGKAVDLNPLPLSKKTVLSSLVKKFPVDISECKTFLSKCGNFLTPSQSLSHEHSCAE